MEEIYEKAFFNVICLIYWSITLSSCLIYPNPESIEIVSQPDTVSFALNEKVSFKGLTIRIKYDDNSYSDIIDVKSLTLSSVDTSTIGDKIVKVKYTIKDKIYETEFTINVYKPHIHTYSAEWSSNDTHHWHGATCEHFIEVSEMAEHSFDEWTVITPSTHLVKGQEKRTCECGEIEYRDIKKLTEHTFGEWTVITPSTHLVKGQEKRTCECGEIEYHDIEKLTEHTFGEWTVITPSTHLVKGQEKRTCECGEIEYRGIEKLTEHTFGEWTVTISPTCTTEGSKTRSCQCGNTETEVIEKNSHSFSTSWFNDSINHWHECTGCNIESEKGEHNWVNDECTICHKVRNTEGLVFSLNTAGTEYSVTGYTGTSKLIRIIETYNDLPITAIAEKAFIENTNLESIFISATIVSIGNKAFYYCENLQSVIFADNSQLLTIGDNAFYFCLKLSNIILPNKIVSIGDYSFSNSEIISINIPSSLISIGMCAFMECTKLETITFEILTNWYAIFETKVSTAISLELSSLNQSLILVYITHQYTEYHWFLCTHTYDNSCDVDCNNCGVVRTVIHTYDNLWGSDETHHWSICTICHQEDSNKVLHDYVEDECTICHNIRNTEGLIFSLNASETQYSVTGYTGTATNVKIASIYEGKPVKIIDNIAFIGCDALISIFIPESIISIGIEAFSSCNNLTSVFFKQPIGWYYIDGSNIITISSEELNNVISATTKLQLITSTNRLIRCEHSYDNACDTICNNCGQTRIITHTYSYEWSNNDTKHWHECTICHAKDEEVDHNWIDDMCNICNGVRNTEGLVFSLNVTNDSYSVTSYNGTAAKVCINNTYNGLPITMIADKAFEENKIITSIFISASIVSIGEEAFYKCENLQLVIFANNSQLLTIDNYAFYFCIKISSITLPNQITSIGKFAFSNSYIESIIIPASVTFIDRCAFLQCTKLENVTFNNTNNWYIIVDEIGREYLSLNLSLLSSSKTSMYLCYRYSEYYWFVDNDA